MATLKRCRCGNVIVNARRKYCCTACAKAAQLEQMAEWRKNNQDRLQEWKEENKESQQEYMREYMKEYFKDEEHKNKQAARMKKYREKKKGELIENDESGNGNE